MSRVDETDIPEVVAFIQVQQQYDSFRQANRQFFDYLDKLAAEYNEKLVDAEKAVRARGVSCGPFHAYQKQVTYNADALYELMGREKFLELGGKEELQKIRSVDKKRIDMNIATNKIPQEVACEVRKESPRYKKPGGITL